MRVFVTGATGYVGRPLVQALLAEGHQVVSLERPGSRRRWAPAGVTVATGNILQPAGLAAAMAGCDAVIHLVGIIREVRRRGITMDSVHRQGTEHLLAAAQAAGVRRWLQMSALGTRAGATSGYHRSKWAGEEAVRRSGLDWTIFRPSVVFGAGGPGPNFVQQLADLVRLAPVVPVIGDGTAPLQPVGVRDVARAFARALVTPASIGKTYEVGGPAVVTYEEILRAIAAHYGKKLRPLHLPIGLMAALVPALQHAPGFPLTMDQLTMLREGNACADGESIWRDLGLTPEPFRVELPGR